MDSNYIVQTEYGKVRGFPQKTLLDVPYIRYLGIPYATPPVGNLRFKSPLKPSPWGDRVIDCDVEKSPCASLNSVLKRFVGSDDCLYLNVFTKDLNPKKPYAVMVYIHGGGHARGSSTLTYYSPDYILSADVVLVTFNYRVGPLGFLTLKDKSLDVPGNAGMKDQQLAMRFVKDNIRNFGGDPNNCTLFGHSSGATCVGLHCVAETSRGLFDRALIMSGSPVATESVVKDENYALQLAKKLGFNGVSESDVLGFLEKVDALAMSEAQDTLIEAGIFFMQSRMPFGPCIEPYDSDSAFMIKRPLDLLKSAWSNDIDVMIGGAADEGLLAKSEFENGLRYEQFIPLEIKRKVSDEKLTEFAIRLKDFYQSRYPSEFDALVKLNGDGVRWLAMQRWIHARQNANRNRRTFLYRFAVDSPTQNHYRNRWHGKGSKGVVHADELSYLWKNDQGDVPPQDSIEFISIMRFTCLLTSFAVTGDPNSNVLDLDFSSFVWKPVDVPPYKGLDINEKLEFKTFGESVRLQLLESFYRELSIPLF